jgi:lysophospholipase L1-like esterase
MTHMTRLLLLLTLLICGPLLAVQIKADPAEAQPTKETEVEAKPYRYQSVIDAWVEQDATNPPSSGVVVFIGSSSIRGWKTLKEDFPQYDVINRGFGGSTFADANLFINQIVTPYEPSAVVVFEGSNDIASGKTGTQVFEDYKQFVKLVRAGSNPELEPAPILFIGITPTESRWKHWPEMKIANDLIREYTDQHDALYYIDTPRPILATAPTPDGPPSSDLFKKDLLHLSPAGYALWTEVVTPDLEAVCPPPHAEVASD